MKENEKKKQIQWYVESQKVWQEGNMKKKEAFRKMCENFLKGKKIRKKKERLKEKRKIQKKKI